MNKRSLFLSSLIIVLSAGILASPVWAGNVQRNRWEGVAIGVGAAILGKVILDHVQDNRSRPEPVYNRAHRSRWHRYPPHRPQGHWEIRKVWVPPVYKSVWNPGHYNRRGRWVSGQWIEIEKESGYWRKEKIWVSDRSHASHYR